VLRNPLLCNQLTICTRGLSHVIQRPKITTPEQNRHSRISRDFFAKFDPEITVEAILDTWEQFHTQLQLSDLLLVLKRLVDIKLNNMHQLRAKLTPSEQNPLRDSRMLMLLEAVQVRILNGHYCFDSLADNAELCRAMAVFRFESPAFWTEMAEIIKPQISASSAPQAIADIAWAFGRLKLAEVEVRHMFETLSAAVVANDAAYENDQLFLIVWGMHHCLCRNGDLIRLYDARVAQEEETIVVEEVGKLATDPAKYTDLYDLTPKPKADDVVSDLYASDDSEEDRILSKDTLPEWALRLQTFRPKTIAPDAHPVEILQHYREIVDTQYEGPHAIYGESTPAQEKEFANLFPRAPEPTAETEDSFLDAFGRMPEMDPAEADEAADRYFNAIRSQMLEKMAEDGHKAEENPVMDSLLRLYIADIQAGRLPADLLSNMHPPKPDKPLPSRAFSHEDRELMDIVETEAPIVWARDPDQDVRDSEEDTTCEEPEIYDGESAGFEGESSQPEAAEGESSQPEAAQ
jgi:hypothetical protein